MVGGALRGVLSPGESEGGMELASPPPDSSPAPTSPAAGEVSVASPSSPASPQRADDTADPDALEFVMSDESDDDPVPMVTPQAPCLEPPQDATDDVTEETQPQGCQAHPLLPSAALGSNQFGSCIEADGQGTQLAEEAPAQDGVTTPEPEASAADAVTPEPDAADAATPEPDDADESGTEGAAEMAPAALQVEGGTSAFSGSPSAAVARAQQQQAAAAMAMAEPSGASNTSGSSHARADAAGQNGAPAPAGYARTKGSSVAEDGGSTVVVHATEDTESSPRAAHAQKRLSKSTISKAAQHDLGRHASQYISKPQGALRRQEAAVEAFVMCGAATLERSMSQITPDSIAESGRKKLLASLESDILRSMQAAGVHLLRAVEAFSSSSKLVPHRDNNPTIVLLPDEAARFFHTLVRASIMLLSPVAAGWAVKVYELFGHDFEKLGLLVGDLPDGEPSPMLSGAVAEAIHARWEETAGELAQMWQAFCTSAPDSPITHRDIARAFVGDGAVSLAAMTQVVLCRPRISTPKELHAPVAGASPLFAGVPVAWVAGARSQRVKYSMARLVFSKPRSTKQRGTAFALNQVILFTGNGDYVRGVEHVELTLVDGPGDHGDPLGREVEIENHLQDPGMGVTNLLKEHGTWKLRVGQAYPRGRVEVRFQFARDEAVAGYIMQTSGQHQDHDPAAWLFQGYDAHQQKWLTLHHAPTGSVHIPRKREAWSNPVIYNDASVLEAWLGNNLLVKDDVGCRIAATANVVKDKAYLILLFLSPWMAKWEIYARMASTFYMRNAKRRNFEMVVVPSTPDQDGFRELYRALPCASVVHSEAQRIKLLETMCQFDGTVKAVVFHCAERLADDLSPLLLTEDGFQCMRRDPDAKRFPWSVYTAEDDGDAEAAASGAAASGGAAAPGQPAQPVSRKAKYIPYMTAANVALAVILGVCPIALALSQYNKGTCLQHEVTFDGEVTDVCMKAMDPGGATCNKSLLQTWFLVNGIVVLFLMALTTFIVVGVWRAGLHRWDLTLADSWASGCCIILSALFLLGWYVLGNVLIWTADDALCGKLSEIGRVYFCVSYVVYTALIVIFCCSMARDRPEETVSARDVENPRSEAGAGDASRRRASRKASRSRSHGQNAPREGRLRSLPEQRP
eukprot:TRINITY_DN11194_c0_g1_i2.p1 TRINITY_DN11194_c0_g1~~TRINITY_DN11194_c0_g1_i2.p1  ORF type:complete len:1142 (+),score=309.31 TRINITY_DN11194_c0_g1_i2:58-3483(+)